MTFPRPWWAKKERVFPLRDEAAGREVVDQCPVHLLVEVKIKAIERAIGIAEAGLFVPALEEPVLSAQELVGHQRRHEIDREESLGLRLTQAGFEDRGHAREAEFVERVIEFDQIHGRSPVWRSMRSGRG